MNNKKSALFKSLISLLLCFSMLIGTTFAWFTDSVTTGINTIAAGTLDVELYHSNAVAAEEKVVSATELFLDLQGKDILWEPGVVSYENLRVANEGDLALDYRLSMVTANENYVLDPSGAQYGLSQILKVGFVRGGVDASLDRAEIVQSVTEWTALSSFIRDGSLLPKGNSNAEETVGVVIYWQPGENDNLWNLNNDKKLSEGKELSIDLGVRLVATQSEHEEDSFGNDYDTEASKSMFPDFVGGTASASVSKDNDNKTTAQVSMTAGQASAVVPAGVQLADGVNKLTMTVAPMDSSNANLTLNENEEVVSLDVHIEGVDETNNVPITVTLKKAAPVGLNIGNYKLYHVENGTANQMTLMDAAADFTAHNQFKYDPATGDLTLYMATFSEVSVVAEAAKWEGKRDYSWYDASKTDLTIANADQLAGFGAIVGGMVDKTADSFKGKTVKLIANINIGDLDSENGFVFYPIGYYNDEGTYEKSGKAITSGFKTFEGTFDGNGHTVSNFYQNTWEMKGDHDWYEASEQHYRDGMGLFGKVYGGTVKNLTVKNFSSDGEIATTGTIAAYADCGATFENIAIFDCNPRVYNIGNGGIVGCVGWYANDAHTAPVTFKNITVDNSNKISALWGSWDVSCGGLVGQYYPTSGQKNAIDNGGIYMENCHVAAQIDVYNDVCANYQYYAYRYAGMLVGSVRENETIDGHVYPKMDGITAKECTVHFGDWNDYYYCELVANSLASYTHDHQMSRLEQVAAVNGTTITPLEGAAFTVPSTGRYNYVVVKAKDANGEWIHGDGAEYATCYHFVDGAVWNHADAGEETVDGKTVLMEDKQLIYREFDQLITGYGWGVTSKGVDQMDGVTILDREEGNSVKKFDVQESISNAYRANNERAVGKLFKAAAIADPKLAIKGDKVQVTVSPKPGTESTAGCIYIPNTTDWTKGSIVFTGKGAALITITDYYFCTATTVEVEIVENRVTGLSVKTNKNLYDISKRETFSAGDITVSAVYSDGNARTLDVSDYTYAFKENAGDFTAFGEKTGVVTYTYAEDIVTAEFKVVAVNMNELTLAGVPESGVEGEQRIQRYFEQFGINGVGQKFYTAAGNTTVDGNLYGTDAALTFATGTVNYTINSHAGNAFFDETDKNGQLTINCTSAPFTDIFGYVGYADRVPVAFGVYVDTTDNLTYTLPMEANADIVKLTGTENARICYIQAPLNTMNLSAGEHKVHFVSIFEDGIQPLTTWTVNITDKEDVDLSTKNANVIILAGQSNAYGASALTDVVKGVAAGVDYSNIFINYSNINCENGVWKSLFYNSGFEPYHPGVGGSANGLCFGPEVGMAYQLATTPATKDEVWYIVKYTAAGSILDGQWLEGTYDNEGLVQDMGGYLSDLMIDYVHDSLNKIHTIHGDNVTLHSFVWMQGESDALTTDSADKYQANEAALVNKVRDEFATYAKNGNGENIVFVSGAIANNANIQHGTFDASGNFVPGYYDENNKWVEGNRVTPNGWTYSGTVNNGKKANAKVEWNPAETGGYLYEETSYELTNSAFVDTSSLLVGANSGENNDPYHYSSLSMWKLGTWFGTAVDYVASLIQ